MRLPINGRNASEWRLVFDRQIRNTPPASSCPGAVIAFVGQTVMHALQRLVVFGADHADRQCQIRQISPRKNQIRRCD
jgi:hypothetical protein